MPGPPRQFDPFVLGRVEYHVSRAWAELETVVRNHENPSDCCTTWQCQWCAAWLLVNDALVWILQRLREAHNTPPARTP
jgi:hypothetical protein